jgi:DnaJ-class molecular chaperone
MSNTATATATTSERFTIQPDGARTCNKCGMTAHYEPCEACHGDGVAELDYDANGHIIGANPCPTCQGNGGEWVCDLCQGADGSGQG